MIETILVPKERQAIFSREVMNDIQKRLEVKINREGNTVLINGEGLGLYKAKMAVKAIARGFSPERIEKLYEEDSIIDVIDLGNMKENRLKIIKSRIIGTRGKTRKKIEEASEAIISVYGKTIALIGTYEQIQIAKEAINMIISGLGHKTVYIYLEKVTNKND